MNIIKKIGVAVATLGLASATSQAVSVGTGCLNLTYPGTVYGLPSYVDAHVTFNSGGFGDGVYDAFCANIDRPVDINTVYSITTFAINDPLVTSLGLVINPANLDKVEYILNQAYQGQDSGVDGNFTSDDVQVAIWYYLDGEAALGANQSALNFSQARLDLIIAAADANDGFVAGCDQLKAYILNPVALGCAPVADPDSALPVFQNLVVGIPFICPPPLEDPVFISCVSDGTGTVGEAYSSSLVATGGKVPYTFSLTAGSLPPGLTLDVSSGLISGISTQAGAFEFTAMVVDSLGTTGLHTASVECSIVIDPTALDLTCSSVTAGQVGSVFSASLSASGGIAPYTFAVVSDLPPGLSLSSGGVLSGTPTVAGTFALTVSVTDTALNGVSRTVTKTCPITIAPNCIPIAIQCLPSGSGTVGAAYSATFPVTGGTGPFTFTKVSGYFPPGLTLNASTGTLSGTPTGSGTYTFTVKVVDSSGTVCGSNQTASVCCSVTIQNNCPPITLGCVSATTGKVGTSYSATLSVSGGVAPYTFSIISGSLPAGLTLNSSSGTISGTPTSAGTFSFTAKVKSANYSACGCDGYDTVCCSIKIDPATTCSPLVSGDTATIGYWNGPNGQALIKSLNGGSSSTKLGNWLATSYPYLWGANAGSKNLTGKSNAQVAAFFQNVFSNCGSPKTEAQMLAAALAVYVTDSDYAGTTAQASGFNVSKTGTGAKCYNIGCYGSSIGLSNNQNYNVLALLAQANLKKKQGCFNSGSFNTIFDGINRKGDRL